ncbi:uncharacterized protein SPPG_08253 [Spizellomyces punctatus DAOM BR117]|uniref:Cytochrome P450 n=1 Tax=Spizellomyces punctatus (strain DAOM BR117) TaxID=645134 RepID=A0A0L0H551_SPIPD|nr:uncharacterized protein SPPG_08253 [Spizellomyces punctatus DAOM BR117]KNC96352.1 hypothetical protein SPPG_08253 [Spizellomyces punctatus DAOM BR117]|eukprot:XP_016604392.1 hypothetical protein SPPG_08253 [Spizellomyces punctatus DAOM BR117]
MEKEGVVAMWFGGRWNIVAGHPDMSREIYSRTDDFVKSGNNEKIPHSVLAYFLGANIISTREEAWQRFRTVLAPGFRQHWKPAVFQECVKDMIEEIDKKCKNAEVVETNNLMQRLSMDGIGMAAFGKKFNAIKNPNTAISVAHSIVKKSIFKPLFLFFPVLDRLPIKSRIDARRRIDWMESVLFEAAEKAVEEDNQVLTIIARLVKAYESGILTKKEFRDNLMVIFVAGHENVQQALTSLLYLLAKHQDVQDKARAEVQAYSLEELTTAERMPSLPYLQRVVKETLRMYPPIPMLINRCTTRPTFLGRFIIPAQTYVGWHAFGAHHDRRVWKDPEVFDPERFGDGVGRYEWVPFSEGERKCLGMKLALTEMQTIAAVLLHQYTWDLTGDAKVKMTPGGLLAPVGLRLQFERLE